MRYEQSAENGDEESKKTDDSIEHNQNQRLFSSKTKKTLGCISNMLVCILIYLFSPIDVFVVARRSGLLSVLPFVVDKFRQRIINSWSITQRGKMTAVKKRTPNLVLALFHSLCSMYFGVQSLTLQPRVELVFVNLFESQINGSKIRFLCFQTVFAWCLFYVFVYLFSLCSVLAFFPPFILFFGLCHFNTDRFLFRSSPSFLYRFFSIHSFRCFVFYFTLFFLSASLSLTLGGVQLKRRENVLSEARYMTIAMRMHLRDGGKW